MDTTMTTIANAGMTEHYLETPRHKTYYLSAGAAKSPLIIFIHGWPECSLSWRHQLPFFAALGFRAIAPDMRGYGNSSVYKDHDSYRQELIVADMIELLDSLGEEKAVWVGHDWGSPVAWNIASHHPERCHAVASLCVPYATVERDIDALVDLADRTIYPSDRFPVGQWDYMRFYEENFAKATAEMDANPGNVIKLLFQKGSAAEYGLPAFTAFVRENGGWFQGLTEAPDVPLDEDVITETDLSVYASALAKNGFFGPNSWYMNHSANADYYNAAVNNGIIDMPALFIAAKYDHVCESINSRLGEPMRGKCRNLSEALLETGHWMAQEKPKDVNRELVKWLATSGVVDKLF